MADIFDAISNPARRSILQVLLEGDASSSAIAAAVPLEAAEVTRQLAILRKAGLVVSTGEGAKKTHHLDPAPLQELDGWLVPFLDAAGSFHGSGEPSVFGAWSGADVGGTIGRAAADRSHQARTVIQDVSDIVSSKLPKTVTERFARMGSKDAPKGS
ncbi:ArsR family transcriptional regulator [Glaciihabitans arcticus]|uniref:ArsR family transcriptional regulator n=1 Tax=Glaciihabitans arcticus TaxID=2668039 RepID=A0A4V2JF78_9MICO|nr:helix-turn-helix domain-containing protein [Glaciihabitans arcticus]TBN58429.1 ArsR family transcriptional regulator [Glaciihabitans arcticus]